MPSVGSGPYFGGSPGRIRRSGRSLCLFEIRPSSSADDEEDEEDDEDEEELESLADEFDDGFKLLSFRRPAREVELGGDAEEKVLSRRASTADMLDGKR